MTRTGELALEGLRKKVEYYELNYHTRGQNLRDGERPRYKPALVARVGQIVHNGWYGRTYLPDSATIALSSRLMYWKGVPTGGVDLCWTRDLTTSGKARSGGNSGIIYGLKQT